MFVFEEARRTLASRRIMVHSEATGNEYFQIRKLLWDELKLNVHSLEEEELRSAIGSHLIEGNEVRCGTPHAMVVRLDTNVIVSQELRQELAVLVEILTEFQQQNDDIRDALVKRPHVPEPPGRPLLIQKLKLLAADMHGHTYQSPKEAEILDYVLSTADTVGSYRAPMTPRMGGLSSKSFSGDPADAVVLRSGTSSGKRPMTSGSQRPVSRGSTISVSSITAVLDSPEVHRRLNLDEIDAIKENLREALNDERLLLLEDIDFIQGCLEMEKDLIDDDRRQVASVKSPPSLSDLHELRKTLEKSLEDQEVAGILSKANSSSSSFRSRMLTPVPPPDLSPSRDSSPASTRRPIFSAHSTSTSPSLSRNESATRVLRIRHMVQESRDEPYLS